MYQPDPFGSSRPHVRGDCEERYQAIYGSLTSSDKALLDFGCAEGYMGFRFLQDGMEEVAFIDHDEGCLKIIDETAIKHGLSSKVKVYPSLNIASKFDVVLCLDLWSSPGVPRCDEWVKITDKLFISTSGPGQSKNHKLEQESKKYYSSVKKIYQGYQNRIIYRCFNGKKHS